MNGIFDKRTQILLDFIVNLATFLVIINFGCLLLSWLVEFAVSIVNFYTNNSWSEVTEVINATWPTLRLIVGISSIFISLLLTYNKLRPSFMALNLPETAISSQDVPNINGFDPATKQRLESVLATLIKVLSIALLAVVFLDVARFVLTHSEGILSSGSIPVIVIGLPVIIGLVILRIIIHNK